jgi:glycine cleavage system protein P-like pyridoxal-binding family
VQPGSPAQGVSCSITSSTSGKTGPDGDIDLSDLKAKLTDETALLMLTCPNTLGLFDRNLAEAVRLAHEKDALLYCDGANLNALVGVAKPGKFGGDVSHLNLHKTFCIPHGGGGPGMADCGRRSHSASGRCGGRHGR